jgi:hypothetical protein
LPTASVALRSITRGGALIDLRGTRRFTADGFAGEVRSTLVLRLGRAKTTDRLNQPPSGAGHGRRIRNITVTYRVERLRGSAVAADLRQNGECRDQTRLEGAAFATLVLTLRRTGVRTQIFREPSPPGG